MKEALNDLVNMVPTILLSVRNADVKLPVKELMTAAFIGIVSGGVSIWMLTIRLDERMALLGTVQADIKSGISSIQEEQRNLGERVARIEGTINKGVVK